MKVKHLFLIIKGVLFILNALIWLGTYYLGTTIIQDKNLAIAIVSMIFFLWGIAFGIINRSIKETKDYYGENSLLEL